MQPHGDTVTFLRGHLNGSSVLPGTIMGPNAFGELLVVHPCECPDRFDSVEMRTVSGRDVAAAQGRDPQSLTEFKLRKAGKL